MGTFEKRLQDFFRVPVPNDITIDDVISVAEHLGSIIVQGGNHMKVAHPATRTIIPIPRHNKAVDAVYIIQLKKLFQRIQEEERQ